MQQLEGVKETILRFYDRSSAYDVGSVARLVSQKHESMVIGTAPDEWFDAREQWRSAFEMEGVRLEAGDALRSCQEGSVGRVADQSTFVLPKPGRPLSPPENSSRDRLPGSQRSG